MDGAEVDRAEADDAESARGDAVTIVREARGVPAWLVRAYLEELGGVAAVNLGVDAATGEPSPITGDGWVGDVRQIEDHRVGSIVVGQVRIVLKGGAEAIARLQAALERKLLRGGG